MKLHLSENKIYVDGYLSRLVKLNNKLVIAFGCKNFTLEQLQFLHELTVDSKMQAEIWIAHTHISKQHIERLINILNFAKEHEK